MSELGFCRELNLAEPLAGTGADAVTRWILVEDGGRWGAKTPHDTGLPAPVIAWLLARNAEPHTKVQLIRRPGSTGVDTRRRVILADAPADPSERRLIELEVELDRIPELDVAALLEAAPAGPTLAQLWLVCTHGTRDRCCAKWGMPVFEALCKRDRERVWQCSHLGGHRFAPTFLTLPDGLMWGRFDVTRIGRFADALAAGDLTELDTLRGRGCYPRVVQAAECLIRIRDGLVEDTALELVAHAPRETGATWVEFRAPGGLRLGIELEPTRLDWEAPPSCGDTPERRTVLRIRAQTATI